MTIETEITELRDAEGFFKPETILTWARGNSNSDLHRYKAWLWDDDSGAAHLYRLGVARSLIRVYIRTDEGARATFSLVQDRRTGAGYREIEPIMSNVELRKMAVRQALREFQVWERRYRHLKELADIFAAGNAVAASSATAEAESQSTDSAA